MVHARALRGAARGADFRRVSRGDHRRGDFFSSRLRSLRLSAGVLPSPELLAWRVSALERLERLRAALPGSVEYDDTVSPLSDLSAAAAFLVARHVLSPSLVSRRHGHVLSGASLDSQAVCCGGSRCSSFLQRADAVFPDVAQ